MQPSPGDTHPYSLVVALCELPGPNAGRRLQPLRAHLGLIDAYGYTSKSYGAASQTSGEFTKIRQARPCCRTYRTFFQIFWEGHTWSFREDRDALLLIK